MESNSRNHLPDIPQVADEQQLLSPSSKDDSTWIVNEAMLRDEGALYGIAAADISDKLQAIASYFQIKMAPALQKKEFIQQRIQELSLVIGVNTAELERIEERLEEHKPSTNKTLTLLFQLLAVTAVCVFNFFLVQWWLSPVIKSDLICLGIYLAGLFSVYIGRGLTYSISETAKQPEEEQTAKTGWKIFFKEYAVAAAIAVFLCTLTSEVYPLRNTLAAGVLFFLLFLSGKVLVNMFSGFREQAASLLRFEGFRYRQRRAQRSLKKKTDMSTASMIEQRNFLQEPETIIKKLQAEQEYKTRVFLSEYHLATETRQQSTKLPSKQFA